MVSRIERFHCISQTNNITTNEFCTITEIAGEKEYKKYTEFMTDYVKQLSDIEEALDNSLGDTWDMTLDPITLQVSSTCK